MEGEGELRVRVVERADEVRLFGLDQELREERVTADRVGARGRERDGVAERARAVADGPRVRAQRRQGAIRRDGPVLLLDVMRVRPLRDRRRGRAPLRAVERQREEVEAPR